MEVENGRSREKETQEHVGARWCMMGRGNGGVVVEVDGEGEVVIHKVGVVVEVDGGVGSVVP